MKGDLDAWRQGYLAACAQLTKRLRQMNEANWSPTPRLREAKALAKRLKELADDLAKQGGLQFDIEALHDRPLPLESDSNGLPAMSPGEAYRCSYKATIVRIRQLASSADEVAAGLPNARQKLALPFAADEFVRLRRDYGMPPPKLYAAGLDVAEFRAIVEPAGIVLSNEALRNALSEAVCRWRDPGGMD